MKQIMVDMVYRLQDKICDAISTLDESSYREDEWVREEGGGGRSRVFSEGKLFEKAGVNVSVVQGTLSPEAAAKMGGGQELEGKNLDFFATGLSLVLHPHNPMAPTVHANYRYFERGDGQIDGSWWFGGGAILLRPTCLKRMLPISTKSTKRPVTAIKLQIILNSRHGAMITFTLFTAANDEV